MDFNVGEIVKLKTAVSRRFVPARRTGPVPVQDTILLNSGTALIVEKPVRSREYSVATLDGKWYRVVSDYELAKLNPLEQLAAAAVSREI